MPFIRRDEQGRIIALYAFPQTGAEEELDLDHPEVLAFLRPNPESTETRELLAESDLQLARVVEDLITLLVEQDVIRLSDLPPEARRKLRLRGDLRERLSDFAPRQDDGRNLPRPDSGVPSPANPSPNPGNNDKQ